MLCPAKEHQVLGQRPGIHPSLLLQREHGPADTFLSNVGLQNCERLSVCGTWFWQSYEMNALPCLLRKGGSQPTGVLPALTRGM